jgi:hypothetical protein
MDHFRSPPLHGVGQPQGLLSHALEYFAEHGQRAFLACLSSVWQQGAALWPRQAMVNGDEHFHDPGACAYLKRAV